jgi:small subunit ribosomal protein S17
MNKTVVVEVSLVKAHPLYRKRFTTKKKYYVHSQDNAIHVGDVVVFREVPPLSKLKRWNVVSVVSQGVS